MFGEAVAKYAADGLVNMLGGCCGTGPEYIRELKRAVSEYPRR